MCIISFFTFINDCIYIYVKYIVLKFFFWSKIRIIKILSFSKKLQFCIFFDFVIIFYLLIKSWKCYYYSSKYNILYKQYFITFMIIFIIDFICFSKNIYRCTSSKIFFFDKSFFLFSFHKYWIMKTFIFNNITMIIIIHIPIH